MVIVKFVNTFVIKRPKKIKKLKKSTKKNFCRVKKKKK